MDKIYFMKGEDMDTIEVNEFLLNELDEHQLREVITWTLVDLQMWSLNDDVITGVRGHSAMMHEAILHQINKQLIKDAPYIDDATSGEEE